MGNAHLPRWTLAAHSPDLTAPLEQSLLLESCVRKLQNVKAGEIFMVRVFWVVKINTWNETSEVTVPCQRHHVVEAYQSQKL
jgi:hypothetical protein